MKWLFLNPIKSGWGGMENWMLNLCLGLRDQGDECLVVGRPSSPWREQCARHQVPFEPCSLGGDFAFWTTMRLRGIVRGFVPDVACVKGFRQARFVRRASPSIPIGVKLPLPGELTDAWADRLTLRFCVDRVFTDSHRVRAEFVRLPWVLPGKVHAVHNGVQIAGDWPDSGRRAQARAAFGIDSPGRPVVAAVGRLSTAKRYADALTAFAAGAAQTDAVLLIIGDGPNRADLEEHAAALGLGAGVRFLGWRDDVRELLWGCDVLIHPSTTEGLPNVVLEAMAAGVAVIATDAGGTREIIASAQDGCLVSPGDVAGMAQALTRLLGDIPLRKQMAARGAALVRERFTIAAMVNGVRSVFVETQALRQALYARAAPLSDGTSWVRRPDAEVASALLDAAHSPGAEQVSSTGKSQVVRLRHHGRLVYVKEFCPPWPAGLLRYGLRSPLALRSFRTAQRLGLMGAEVVPHLAASWRRCFGLVRSSTLVTGTAENAPSAYVWFRQSTPGAPGRRVFCRDLGRWMASLHGAAIFPHDLKMTNVLVVLDPPDGFRFLLLDLDNTRIRLAGLFRREILRNFHQVFRSFETVATPREMLTFAASYGRRRGLCRRDLRGLLQAFAQRLRAKGLELPAAFAGMPRK